MSRYKFRKFMEKSLDIIKTVENHPLKFLLKDDKWVGRWPKDDPYSVQAGHVISKRSGLTERFMVEDAAYNQMYSKPERRMTIYRSGISIEGIPVELETARYWMNTNKISKEVFQNAEPTLGWE